MFVALSLTTDGSLSLFLHICLVTDSTSLLLLPLNFHSVDCLLRSYESFFNTPDRLQDPHRATDSPIIATSRWRLSSFFTSSIRAPAQQR
jgi:hypothetical protein